MWDSKREFLSILIYGMKSEKKNFHQNIFFHVPPHMDWKLSWRFFKISKKNFFSLILFHISKWTWITLQNIILKSFWHISVSHSIRLKLLHFMEAEVTILNHYCGLLGCARNFLMWYPKVKFMSILTYGIRNQKYLIFGPDILKISGPVCVKIIIVVCAILPLLLLKGLCLLKWLRKNIQNFLFLFIYINKKFLDFHIPKSISLSHFIKNNFWRVAFEVFEFPATTSPYC